MKNKELTNLYLQMSVLIDDQLDRLRLLSGVRFDQAPELITEDHVRDLQLVSRALSEMIVLFESVESFTIHNTPRIPVSRPLEKK